MVNNQKGSIIIMVLVSMVAVFIMFIAFMNGITNQITLQTKEQSKFGIDFMQQKIKGTLASEFAWRRTIEADPQFSCLRTPGAVCTPSGSSLFSLRNSDDTIVMDSASTGGFDIYGEPCNTFSSAAPNESCPFRYELTWRCEGACPTTEFLPSRPLAINPKIVIIATLKTTTQKVNVNATDNSFTQIVGWEEQNLSSVCNSLAGYFNDNSGKCNLLSPDAGSRCSGPSEYVAGIDRNGVPICGTFTSLARFCPNNYAVVGINTDGSLKCDKF